MPNYALHLSAARLPEVIVEPIEAVDDDEALTFAEMRLLLTTAYEKVVVFRDGALIRSLIRDSISSQVRTG